MNIIGSGAISRNKSKKNIGSKKAKDHKGKMKSDELSKQVKFPQPVKLMGKWNASTAIGAQWFLRVPDFGKGFLVSSKGNPNDYPAMSSPSHPSDGKFISKFSTDSVDFLTDYTDGEVSTNQLDFMCIYSY